MTTKVKVKCSHCGQSIRVPEEKLGAMVRCPACRQQVLAVIAGLSTNTGDTNSAAYAVNTLSGDHALTDNSDEESEGSAIGHGCGNEPRMIAVIGRFEVRRELGEGGFGKVYEAFDPQLGRTVALKVPTFGSENRRRVRRFITEARSAARLHHPNIVAVYENGQSETGQLYIASEFVDGTTLKELLQSEDAPLREKVGWIRDLAEALAYAHSEGIVHRDMKPENILVDRIHRRPKIVDFGLAKVLDESADGADAPLKTQDGVLGTPAFMAPEQARGELNSVGPHSDQYSLGAVLYQCLTGSPPFQGSVYMIIAAVAGDEEPPSIRSLVPATPKDLIAVCEKAMSKATANRYETCEMLMADLTAWLNEEPVMARPLSMSSRAVRFIRRHPWPTGFALVSIVLLATIAITMSAAYEREQRTTIAIEQQRQQAIEQNLRAETLVAELSQKNAELLQKQTEVEAAREQINTEKVRAESALSELQRQVGVAATESKRAEDATQLATTTQRTASEQVDYNTKMREAARLMQVGMPKSARDMLLRTPSEKRHFEYFCLKAGTLPIYGKWLVPDGCLPDQVSASADLSTIVLRSDTNRFHVGRVAPTESPNRGRMDWIVVQGLPESSASLTPSGHDLVFVSELQKQLAVAMFTLPMVSEVVPKKLPFLPFAEAASFPSGISITAKSTGGIVIYDPISRMSYDHCACCSPFDRVLSALRDSDVNLAPFKARRKGQHVFRLHVPGRSLVMVGFEDGAVEVYKSSGDVAYTVVGQTGVSEPPKTVAFSPARDQAAILKSDSVRIFNIITGKTIRLYQPMDGYTFRALGYDSTGTAVAVHCEASVNSNADVITVFYPSEPVESVLFPLLASEPNIGKWGGVAYDSAGGNVICFSNRRAFVVSDNKNSAISTYTSTDGEIVGMFSASDDSVIVASTKTISKWNWKLNQVERLDLDQGLWADEEIATVFWSPVTQVVAIVTRRELYIDKRKLYKVFAYSLNERTMVYEDESLGWDGTGETAGRLFAVNHDGTLFLVRPPNTGNTVLCKSIEALNDGISLVGSDGTITSADFSHDDLRVVTGHSDGSLRVWNAATGEQMLATSPGKSAITSIKFRHDDKVVVGTLADGSVRLFGDVYPAAENNP